MSQTNERPTGDQPPGTPRWVKVFGIVVLVLILLITIAFITGLGGEHGPGRHLPSGDTGDTRFASIIVDRTSSGGGLTTPPSVIVDNRPQL
jgi:hypothetical protein